MEKIFLYILNLQPYFPHLFPVIFIQKILDFLHFLANFGTDRKSRLQLHPVCFHDFFKLFENHVFWSKSRFLGLKVLIFRQNSIFGQKYDFWHSVMYEIMRILHVVSFLVANS